MYESDQDAFRNCGIEALREHRGTETYGTMGGYFLEDCS